MSLNGINGILKQIVKDGKIIFIVLATLLITLSLVVYYNIHLSFLSLEKALLIGFLYFFVFLSLLLFAKTKYIEQ